MAGTLKDRLRQVAGVVLRVVVLVITVILLVMMFDRGGWWIAICLAWLPVNFIVVAYFGDDKKSADYTDVGPFV